MAKTVLGTLTNIERLGSSTNGNPRYAVTLNDSDTYRTLIDGSVGYEVTNHRVGSPVALTLGPRAAVIDMNAV